MFSPKLIAFVAALMAQEAAALNAHRHAHNDFHADKRAVVYVNDVVTVTDWTIVTVYEDAPGATQSFYKGTHTETTSSSTVAPVVSSSTKPTSSVAPTTSSSSSSSSIPSPAPVYTPTTLATYASSSAAAATTSSVPHANGALITETVTTAPAPPVASSTAPAPAPTSASSSAFNWWGVFGSSTTSTTSTAAAAPTSSSPAPTSTPKSSSSSSSSSSSGTSSGSKRGLAYNEGSLLSPFLNSGNKVGWSYNWGQKADPAAPSGLEFIPMLWSPSSLHTGTWHASAAEAISAGAPALLGFNECDNAGQCALDAASAAAAHITYMNPYSGQARIGAPAITNSNLEGEGLTWLKSFISACNGQCSFDFCPVHWYNYADSTEFLSHLTKAHAICGKPLWITEFAPFGTDDEISAFLETIMDSLDNDPTYAFVERYSYFMAATGSLLTSSTSLSTYGNTYAYN